MQDNITLNLLFLKKKESNAQRCRRFDLKFPTHSFIPFKALKNLFKSGLHSYKKLPQTKEYSSLHQLNKQRPFLHEVRSLDH